MLPFYKCSVVRDHEMLYKYKVTTLYHILHTPITRHVDATNIRDQLYQIMEIILMVVVSCHT